MKNVILGIYNVIAVSLPQLKDSTKRRTIDSHFLKEKICRTKVRDAASCLKAVPEEQVQGHVCSEAKRVSYHIAFMKKKGRDNNKTCNT